MKSIPTWGWVLIVLAVVTVAIIAFRKPLKAWMDKRKAAANGGAAKPAVDTSTTTVVQPDGSETVLAKMRRVA